MYTLNHHKQVICIAAFLQSNSFRMVLLAFFLLKNKFPKNVSLQFKQANAIKCRQTDDSEVIPTSWAAYADNRKL